MVDIRPTARLKLRRPARAGRIERRSDQLITSDNHERCATIQEHLRGVVVSGYCKRMSTCNEAPGRMVIKVGWPTGWPSSSARSTRGPIVKSTRLSPVEL